MSMSLRYACLVLWKTLRRLLSDSCSKLYLFFTHILERDAANRPAPTTRLERLPAASFPGSTGIFFRLEPGVILKSPVKIGMDQVVRERHGVGKYFHIEERVLNKLGAHPRIVKLLGSRTDFPTGLLFAEASHGNLQAYLDEHGDAISNRLRSVWFLQAIEAVAFIHTQGVIHSDLRPENFLVHGRAADTLGLWLCDFGGASCGDLSAGKLPDSGFFNPTLPSEPTTLVDVFSLGSVLYTIMTGHWPFRPGVACSASREEMQEYEEMVDAKFASGIFPEIKGVLGGQIIHDCWTGKFANATEIDVTIANLELG